MGISYRGGLVVGLKLSEEELQAVAERSPEAFEQSEWEEPEDLLEAAGCDLANALKLPEGCELEWTGNLQWDDALDYLVVCGDSLTQWEVGAQEVPPGELARFLEGAPEARQVLEAFAERLGLSARPSVYQTLSVG